MYTGESARQYVTGAHRTKKKRLFTPRHTAPRRLRRCQRANSCGATTLGSSHPTCSRNIFIISAPLAAGETLSITAFVARPRRRLQ